MNSFLTYVKTYESLIELLLTVITISLSLFAIFQTHRLSKRQLEQEKRIVCLNMLLKYWSDCIIFLQISRTFK